MNYQIYQPQPVLARYIKCYWTLEVSLQEEAPSRQKVFADGCIELIFHYGDLFKKYSKNDEFILQPRSFVHGQVTSFIELEASGNTGMFSIRFNPNGLRPFINYGTDELTDQTATVSELWGNQGKILEDRMLNATTNLERVTLAENFLISKLESSDPGNKLAEYCLQSIVRSNGVITIDQLAKDLSIGRRQLERKFITAVGLSPKMLSRIIRFQNVLQMIENRQFTSLTAVAYEGGFYDQAHFIKDFREFTGLNPKQYFSEDLEMARYFI